MLSALGRRLARRFNPKTPFVFVTTNTRLENGHAAETVNNSNIKTNSLYACQLADSRS